MTSNDKELRDKWNRFIEEAEPHRLALFRYCLGLTNNPFDAEDLVSESIMKTFVSRSFTDETIESTLAFLIRVASRTWIDEKKRTAMHTSLVDVEEQGSEDVAAFVTDAANSLYEQLQPEQRAVMGMLFAATRAS